MGRMAEHVGGRFVLGLGILVSSLLTLLTPFAARTSIGFLVVLRILEGLALVRLTSLWYMCLHADWNHTFLFIIQSRLDFRYCFLYEFNLCKRMLHCDLTERLFLPLPGWRLPDRNPSAGHLVSTKRKVKVQLYSFDRCVGGVKLYCKVNWF